MTSRSASGTRVVRQASARSRASATGVSTCPRGISWTMKSCRPQTMSWCRLSTSDCTVDAGARVRTGASRDTSAVGSPGTLTWTRRSPARSA